MTIKRRLARAASVRDLRELARSELPAWVFDYIDGGAFDEATLRANSADLAAMPLRQRVAIDVTDRMQSTKVLGVEAALPLAIAPTGLAGFVYPDGELHGARAAAAAGIPYCLSTVSICSIEDVAAVVSAPFWFQVYIMKDREFTRSLIQRAREAGCSTLVLTLDVPLQGRRRRDISNGLTVPPRLSLASLLGMARKPRWAWGMLCAARFSFGNLPIQPEGQSVGSLAKWVMNSFDPSVDWDDVAWLRDLWPGKLIVKGILDPSDAEAAVRAGADAIVVSNHGGRQLDGASSSISAVRAIVDTVGKSTEILFDGGISSGLDVLKAVASGVACCFVGKAYLYGLGAGGEDGVAKMLEIIRSELDVGMALTGLRDIGDASPDILSPQ